jgi:predicted ferric reductase
MIPRRTSPATAPALGRILMYLALIATPPVLAAILPQSRHGGHRFVPQLANNLALVGYTIVALQFILAARLQWIERSFGLDMIFAFHKAMALLAVVFLLAHPLLMAWGEDRWSLLNRWNVSWPIQVGRIALLWLAIAILIACFRKTIHLEYERWRSWHNVLVVGVLVLGFVHSIGMGDLRAWPMRPVWGGMFGAALLAYGYHRFFSPYRGRRHPFEVVEVRWETHDVWTLTLRPTEARRNNGHLPGQFHFLTLYRQGLPTEEHPFTISSGPAADGSLASTIKESGDFTRTIMKTTVGDRVAVRGPFGRFSHVLHPEEDDLVFIAGGVGITPLMSMLRSMRDTGDWKDVLLIDGNRTEDDIIFGQELREMAGGPRSSLKVVHVLSHARGAWQGERGHIDRALILRHAGERLDAKAFYICGPPVMAGPVIASLRELGVPPRRIHTERFAL